MEALKSDYFEAVCLLVLNDPYTEEYGVPDLGLGAAVCIALRWYIQGPGWCQDILRKTLMKHVLDARQS